MTLGTNHPILSGSSSQVSLLVPHAGFAIVCHGFEISHCAPMSAHCSLVNVYCSLLCCQIRTYSRLAQLYRAGENNRRREFRSRRFASLDTRNLGCIDASEFTSRMLATVLFYGRGHRTQARLAIVYIVFHHEVACSQHVC